MSDKLEIPRLKVKKNWHVGLHPDPVDRSHPDVQDDQLIQEAIMESKTRKLFCSYNRVLSACLLNLFLLDSFPPFFC